MRRSTQHVLVVLLGGMMVRIALDGTYLRFVRPSQLWLLVGAGAVMIILAGVSALRDFLARPTTPGDAGGHEHGWAERHSPWLLLAPVLVLVLIPPAPLGADAVPRLTSASSPSGRLLDHLPDGPVTMTVAEFAERAAWDPATVAGREVTLVGFAVPRDDGVELARMRIVCCAADARVNRVRLVGAPAGLTADTWIEVRGTLVAGTGTERDDIVPTMTLKSLRPVSIPDEPYEF